MVFKNIKMNNYITMIGFLSLSFFLLGKQEDLQMRLLVCRSRLGLLQSIVQNQGKVKHWLPVFFSFSLSACLFWREKYTYYDDEDRHRWYSMSDRCMKNTS